MKEIKVILQPPKLQRILEAFSQMSDFPGANVCKIERCSGHAEKLVPANIKDALQDSWPHMRLEILCHDEQVDALVGVITEVAEGGRAGDEVLWVTPVDSFRRFGRP